MNVYILNYFNFYIKLLLQIIFVVSKFFTFKLRTTHYTFRDWRQNGHEEYFGNVVVLDVPSVVYGNTAILRDIPRLDPRRNERLFRTNFVPL